MGLHSSSLSSLSLRILLITCWIFICVGVYEDEVGVYDWIQYNVGRVTGAEFSSSTEQIFVVTDQGAIAALDMDGNLQWRQLLPNGELVEKMILFNNDKHILTLVNGGSRAYLWRAVDGGLMWEQEITSEQDSPNGPTGSTQVSIVGHEVAILSDHALYLISLRSGNILWNAVRSPEGKVIGLTSKESSGQVFVVVQSDNVLFSYLWDTETGGFHLLQNAPFSSSNGEAAVVSLQEILVFGSAQQLCVYDTKEEKALFVCRNLGEGKHNAYIAAVQSSESVLIYWERENRNELFQYSKDETLSIVSDYTHKKIPFFVPRSSSASFFARALPSQEGELLEMFYVERGRKEWKVPVISSEHGAVQYLFQHPNNLDTFLIVCEDDSLSLIKTASGVLWTREESLANIHMGKFMDIPTLRVDVEEVRHPSGILQQFLRRINGQWESMKETLASGLHIGENQNSLLHKDRFGFNKLLLLASRTGKLFCISNTIHHPIIWSLWFPEEEIEDLLISNVASSTDSTLLVLTKKRATGLSSIYLVNPYQGDILRIERLNYAISHSLLFPQKDSLGQRILFMVDEQRNAHVFPNTAEAQSITALLSSSTFDYQVSERAIRGYQVQENLQQGFVFTLEDHWAIQLTENEKVLSIERLCESHIHSAIRLTSSNDPMPKYINRNLFALATLTVDEDQTESVNIYLIDGVTGAIIHHAFHPHTSEPLHMVLCENFLIYSYWNRRSYRTEVSVIEMYEREVDWDSSSFSSFSGILPHVYQQTFEINFFVTCMGITQTRRGITTFNILFGTQSGQLISMDKRWIDPLRPIDEKLAGLIPYTPELPLFSKSYLSHNLQVERIAHIISTSAHLESTSLVFAWGLDHFFTHVRPADKFDMLHSDFDFFSLFGTVGILIVLTSISYGLQKKRKLMQQWK